MSTTLKTRAKNVKHNFMPASQSLVVGALFAACEDIWSMVKALGNLLLEIWLEAVYSTAMLIQRFR